MPVRIKICGITCVEDALAAAALGVDALGFIFVPKSPRYITPELAASIIRELPPFISRVGVFVNEPPSVVVEKARFAHVDTVQLHGSETAEMCRQMPFPVIKAFGLKSDLAVAELSAVPAAGYLLDTWKGALQGGSGMCGDWGVASRMVKQCDRIILAGGLTPANVGDALDTVMPYGVDLNSGVEAKPGIKDPQKMRDAVAIIRAWRPHV